MTFGFQVLPSWVTEASVAELEGKIRALCPETCGCGYPLTDQALTDIQQGCSVDTTGFYHGALRTMPCTDVSAEGDAYDAVALDVMNMTRCVGHVPLSCPS